MTFVIGGDRYSAEEAAASINFIEGQFYVEYFLMGKKHL